MIVADFEKYFNQFSNVTVENYYMEYIIIETTVKINGKKFINNYKMPVHNIYCHYDLKSLCNGVQNEINKQIEHMLQGYNYFMEVKEND